MRWPVKVFKVTGDSMEPTYREGTFLLGSGWARAKQGSVVVVSPPDSFHSIKNIPKSRKHIKRVRDINEEGIWVEGDNPAASTDSRQYGYVQPENIKAVILMRLGCE